MDLTKHTLSVEFGKTCFSIFYFITEQKIYTTKFIYYFKNDGAHFFFFKRDPFSFNTPSEISVRIKTKKTPKNMFLLFLFCFRNKFILYVTPYLPAMDFFSSAIYEYFSMFILVCYFFSSDLSEMVDENGYF